MEALSSELLQILASSFAVALGSVLLLWLISIPLRDVSIIDMFFAVILMAITAVCLYLSSATEPRKWLITGMVGLWGLRITWHLIRRNWGHGEDPRYTKLRSWVADGRSFHWLALKKVFLLQGIVLWFVALPVQFALGQPSTAALGWLAWLGATLWPSASWLNGLPTNNCAASKPIHQSAAPFCRPAFGVIPATPIILVSCACGGAYSWWPARCRWAGLRLLDPSYILT
jgi:steroid 5-alpha reductase family enzyme